MIKKSILLVDDDQRLRELLKDYLNEKNFQIFTSEDFDEAKEILEWKHTTTVILLVKILLELWLWRTRKV